MISQRLTSCKFCKTPRSGIAWKFWKERLFAFAVLLAYLSLLHMYSWACREKLLRMMNYSWKLLFLWHCISPMYDGISHMNSIPWKNSIKYAGTLVLSNAIVPLKYILSHFKQEKDHLRQSIINLNFVNVSLQVATLQSIPLLTTLRGDPHLLVRTHSRICH